MKKTPVTLILMLVSLSTIAQFKPTYRYRTSTDCDKTLIGIGITAGYAKGNYSCGVGEGYIAVKATEHFIVYPMSIKITSRMDDPIMPVVFESRVGYKYKFLETYFGYGFHAAGSDNKEEYKPYTGFKPAAGVIIHLSKKIIITSGLSGFDKNRLFTIQAGFFTFG